MILIPDKQEIVLKIADKTVCKGANIYINGTDPILKDKKEYPDWLWKLEELYLKKRDLTIETDGRRYLNHVNTRLIREKNKLSNIL